LLRSTNFKYIKIFPLIFFVLIGYIYSQDSLTVVSFYNSTNGEDWINNNNWLSDKPLNDWYGLTVNDSNIIKIEIKRNNLTGSLPENFGRLNKLTNLDLSDNNISGYIPVSFNDLKNLDSVDISHNNFSGSIENIINNNKLILLNLSHNEFKGDIPKEVGKLNRLEVLNFSNNNFINKIPSEIFKLNKLTVLNLQGNGLTGTIPRQIGQLRQLKILDLSRNKLIGEIPKEVGKLINLKDRLAINHNQLNGMLPNEICNLTELEYIWLNNNQFSGILPLDIGKMQKLKSFFIYQNRFVGPFPNSLGSLRDLEIFYAQNNSFGGEIPQEIWFLPKLKMLKLGNNDLIGRIPGVLHNLKNIQSIDLSGNRFTAITDTVSLPSSLLSLNIANNQIFCINSTQTDSASIKLHTNAINKIHGIDEQDCSQNGWSSFDIEIDKIDFDNVQTDSSASRNFWIKSNVSRSNILRIQNFNKDNIILSDSLLTIEQDDTTFVKVIYSPISQDNHTDVILIEDIYNNQVKFVTVNGESIETILPERDETIPWRLKLHPVPNSDGTEVTVKYDVPEVRNVNISFYNLGGRPIKKLIDGSVEIGYHSATWDCNDDEGNKIEPSEYLCVMQSGMFIQIQHLMIWY